MRDKDKHGLPPTQSETPNSRVKYGLNKLLTATKTFTTTCGICDSEKQQMEKAGRDVSGTPSIKMCPHCDLPPFCGSPCPICKQGLNNLPEPEGGR